MGSDLKKSQQKAEIIASALRKSGHLSNQEKHGESHGHESNIQHPNLESTE